jgi:putative transposase
MLKIKEKMQLAYKFRLYPTKKQEEKLSLTLNRCRFVYNKMLEGLNRQEKPNKLQLQKQLPSMKVKHPELKFVYSKVLQYEVYRLFSNLKALGRLKKKGKKVGKLRFKGKGWFKSFCYNQSGFKIIETGKRLDKLYLSKIGNIPIKIHRAIDGKIKQIVIKRHNSGKWFACICIERKQEANKKQIKKVVGLDMGIKHFLTDSSGRQVENPHCLKRTLKKLRKEQRKLSKKKKKSENRNKQRLKVAKVHEKIMSQREDFLHKLSRYYVDNYDLIAIENLNIKGIVRNHYLAQSVLDVAWSSFHEKLSYKAENAGKVFVKVDPRNTSKIQKYGKLDRDYNASLNILERGLQQIGQGLSKFTPAEIEPLQELTQVPASSVVEAGSPLC